MYMHTLSHYREKVKKVETSLLWPYLYNKKIFFFEILRNAITHTTCIHTSGYGGLASQKSWYYLLRVKTLRNLLMGRHRIPYALNHDADGCPAEAEHNNHEVASTDHSTITKVPGATFYKYSHLRLIESRMVTKQVKILFK